MTDEQTATTPALSGPRMVANRYRLSGELGRGGMGVVWRAEDTVIGRPVAIKELRLPEGAEDGVFQERVLREVRTGGRINDPAVVTVFDVVADGDTTYIVMELVDAPTLSSLVRGAGPLPEPQVASVGLQVLSALRAAHDSGIVHRDVKPANIMVGANGRVKLTDFGIAQAIDDPRITTSGMLVGSPAFMAPERVGGHEAMPASDLWSLGAALYFAAEGSVPFERASTAATLHAIMNEVPYLTRVQGPLASAIMGLMASNPEGRITSEQAHQLLSLAAQQPAHFTPPGGQPTSQHAGGVPTMLANQPASRTTGTGTPRPRRTKALLAGGAAVAVGALVGGFFLGEPFWSPAVDEQLLPTLTYGDGGDVERVEFNTSYRCLNTTLDRGRSLAESNWVDCDQSHDLELYAWPTPIGNEDDQGIPAARYPSVEELAAYAETACGLVFHSNVVQDQHRPAMTYRALVPSQQQWNIEPDSYLDDASRTVYCFLGTRDGSQRTEAVSQPVK
ncbi:serine/threonine-protein kinase [Saccharomonospora piscinae]|uniref:serine/threonine-protein kinase n=1 Tax=Saccharomonospora piscinae TaxID=687388 RepID=UPI0004663CBA|nr:serine/threonine-protein kinase [Saccharomonospora piscinae]